MNELIESHLAAMVEAWNAMDKDGWAGFTDDVDFTNVYGDYHKSREKVRASHDYLSRGSSKTAQ